MSLSRGCCSLIRFVYTFIICVLFSWCLFSWYPRSHYWLKWLDHKIRKTLRHRSRGFYVLVKVDGESHYIWTIRVYGDCRKATPLILIHGISGGGDLFLNNIDQIAKHRTIYMIDLPGWGLSTNVNFRSKLREDGWWVDTNADDVERFYTLALEDWFKQMRMKRVILFGHGFGAYIASIYSMSYPKRVAHLVLNELWGYYEQPVAAVTNRPFMAMNCIKMVAEVHAKLLIFTPIRFLGPLAMPLYRLFRLGLKEKFMAYWNGLDPHTTSLERIKTLMMQERTYWFIHMTMQDYAYLWMMSSRSGEYAYHRLSIPFGWPRKPLQDRVDFWDESLDMTLIFGVKSWVPSQSGWEIKNHRHDSYVEVHEIGGAGHFVYADRPTAFDNIINLIGEAVDRGVKPHISEDFKQRSKAMSRLRRQVSSSMMLQTTLNAQGTLVVVRRSRSCETSVSSSNTGGVFTVGEEEEGGGSGSGGSSGSGSSESGSGESDVARENESENENGEGVMISAAGEGGECERREEGEEEEESAEVCGVGKEKEKKVLFTLE